MNPIENMTLLVHRDAMLSIEDACNPPPPGTLSRAKLLAVFRRVEAALAEQFRFRPVVML